MQPVQPVQTNAQTYTIRYSRGFDTDLYAAERIYRDKLQEEKIQLTTDQLYNFNCRAILKFNYFCTVIPNVFYI